MEQCDATRLVELLFESWSPYVASYAFHLSGSMESAEDLVQEAFMAFYRALCDGKEIESPRAWILAVVRNLASISARTQRRRREVITAPADFDSLPSPVSEPPGHSMDELSELISILSNREAEVLLLRIESRKYREIAAQLGVSPKTVAAVLARALRKLQTLAAAKSRGEPFAEGKEDHVPKALQ